MASPATSPAQYLAGSGVGTGVWLRQPQGFERLRVVPEGLLVSDSALAHRKGDCELHVRLRAMACATPSDSNNNSVGLVNEVAEQFPSVRVPSLAHLLEL